MQEDRERDGVDHDFLRAKTMARRSNECDRQGHTRGQKESEVAHQRHNWRVDNERRGHVGIHGEGVPVIERTLKLVGRLRAIRMDAMQECSYRRLSPAPDIDKGVWKSERRDQVKDRR